MSKRTRLNVITVVPMRGHRTIKGSVVLIIAVQLRSSLTLALVLSANQEPNLMLGTDCVSNQKTQTINWCQWMRGLLWKPPTAMIGRSSTTEEFALTVLLFRELSKKVLYVAQTAALQTKFSQSKETVKLVKKELCQTLRGETALN